MEEYTPEDLKLFDSFRKYTEDGEYDPKEEYFWLNQKLLKPYYIVKKDTIYGKYTSMRKVDGTLEDATQVLNMYMACDNLPHITYELVKGSKNLELLLN
jgi:hypothetical protein